MASLVTDLQQEPSLNIGNCEFDPLIHNIQSAQTYTVDDAIDRIGAGLFQINVFLYSGSLRAFHAIADIQLALLIPSWQCEFNLSNTQLAILTAMFPLGNMVGINLLGTLATDMEEGM